MRQRDVEIHDRRMRCLQTLGMCFNTEMPYATLLTHHHWRVIEGCVQRNWVHRLKKTDVVRLTGRGVRILWGHAR